MLVDTPTNIDDNEREACGTTGSCAACLDCMRGIRESTRWLDDDTAGKISFMLRSEVYDMVLLK